MSETPFMAFSTYTKPSLFDTMNPIIHKFNIHYTGDKFHTQYTKLSDGRYAKTFVKDGIIDNEFITYEEYISALAHITLREKPTGHNNPIQDII